MSPMSQQIPESPMAAIQVVRRELERLETQSWVRNWQSPGTMRVAQLEGTANQTAEALQGIGLGYTTLATFAVEAAGRTAIGKS